MSSLIRVDYSVNATSYLPSGLKRLVEQGGGKLFHSTQQLDVIDPDKIQIVKLPCKTRTAEGWCDWQLFVDDYPQYLFLDWFAFHALKKAKFPAIFEDACEVSFPGTIFIKKFEEKYLGYLTPTIIVTSNKHEEMWNTIVQSGRSVAIYTP